MKNKFILVTKRLAALALAGAMALAPATHVLADAYSINIGGATGLGISSAMSGLSTSFGVDDGAKKLYRDIADAPKGNDMMQASYINRQRKYALNAGKKVVAAMDELNVLIAANGTNGKTSFQQSAANVRGSFDVIRGKAAIKSTKFSVRVRILDKSGKVIESKKMAVSKPSKSGGKTTVEFYGTWNGESGTGKILVANDERSVSVAYPKVGQKLQFTLYATGANNNTIKRTYTLSRILTGKKSSTDIIHVEKSEGGKFYNFSH